MKKLMQRTVLFAGVMALAAGIAAAQAPTRITLGLAHQRTVVAHGIEKVEVSDPSVIEIKTLSANMALVIGVGAGEATLVISRKSGKQDHYQVTVQRPPSK